MVCILSLTGHPADFLDVWQQLWPCPKTVPLGRVDSGDGHGSTAYILPNMYAAVAPVVVAQVGLVAEQGSVLTGHGFGLKRAAMCRSAIFFRRSLICHLRARF